MEELNSWVDMDSKSAQVRAIVITHCIELTVSESKFFPTLEAVKKCFSLEGFPISIKSSPSIVGRVIHIQYGQLSRIRKVLTRLRDVLREKQIEFHEFRLESCHTEEPGSGFFSGSGNSIKELEDTFQRLGV